MLPISFWGAKSVPVLMPTRSRLIAVGFAACLSAAGSSRVSAQPAQPTPSPAAQAQSVPPPGPVAPTVPSTQSPTSPPPVAAAPTPPPTNVEPGPQAPQSEGAAPAPDDTAFRPGARGSRGAPPAPRYGRFGGDPEPPIEPGAWDPWANPVPGRFEHDGFFLRLQLGPGMASVSRTHYRWTGAALSMGLSIGGSVIENLALHADFHTTLLPNPTEKSFGQKQDFNADIVFESMGIGATYFVMPINMYVSGSVGIGVLAFEDDYGDSKDTDAGLALAGSVGKEWWVGTDWGLGIAAQVEYLRVRDYVKDEAHLNGLTLSILFSATYN